MCMILVVIHITHDCAPQTHHKDEAHLYLLRHQQVCSYAMGEVETLLRMDATGAD